MLDKERESQETTARAFRLVTGDADAPMVFPLPIGRVVRIGTDESCEIRLGRCSRESPSTGQEGIQPWQLESSLVHPLHCELEARPDGVAVRDLGTFDGTYVNGERLHRPVLLRGDEHLRFGPVVARLVTVPPNPSEQLVLSSAASHATQWSIPIAHIGDLYQVSFGDILLAELKKAPWLALSSLGHVLIFAFIWLVYELPNKHLHEFPPPLPLVAQTPEEPLDGLEEALLEEPVAEVAPDDEIVEPDTPPDADEMLQEMEVDLYPPPVEGTGIGSYEIREYGNHKLGQHRRGPGVDEGLERILGSGKLCKTVSSMRKTGLEVVIAFDSTGSMTNVIDQATVKIDEMISVLQALVPQVRVGLVTYRDRGTEEYVTRECPITASRYRLKDFIESVEAAGGQDIPEAVADGLAVAFNKMKWSRSSHRFVILIGDAPPHKRDRNRIARMIRKFVQERSTSSVVSTIITGSGYDTDEETLRSFREIAKKGEGVCVSLNREEKVLREIIRLVFGRQFERTLDDIRAYIADKQRLGEQERDWILHANIDAMIEEGLVPHGMRRISPQVVENLIRMSKSEVKREQIFEKLVELLTRRDLPEETLWAGRYILKQLTNGRFLLDPDAPYITRKQQLQRLRLK